MKLPISVSEGSKEPIYYQIETQLKNLVISGQLAAGTLLPSIRALSSDLSCSVITTRRAYQNLENEGFIQTVQGKGTFVRDIGQQVKAETKETTGYSYIMKLLKDLSALGFSEKEIKQLIQKAILEWEGGNDFE
ncbi:transcriptional regulator, GntR family [Gracilibacillus ureilyticus]|uniref:Transcriptional regulator, GntR family n=1 Tax=Gracilibacillus ureilyticus TaxID=531814 RepID=A0A1H9RMV2_9BACI|nr:GntR family transcriptional regulator [Gracilibacillus ureilyticus]SER74140.1 transcriptional regulator, GntR family [Gracilibacillus ureilyticus]